jgi:hypothetical protein
MSCEKASRRGELPREALGPFLLHCEPDLRPSKALESDLCRFSAHARCTPAEMVDLWFVACGEEWYDFLEM